MMERKLKIGDLKDIGDGSFEKLQEEAREIAGGDSERAMDILAAMVLIEFVSIRRNTESVEQQRREPKILNINWNVRKARQCKKRRTYKSMKVLSSINQTCEFNTKKRVRVWNDESGRKKKKKQKTTKKERVEAPAAPEGLDPPTPDLPDQFKNRIREMNGTEPKLVIQKQVQISDMNEHHMRFALPKGLMKTREFLTRDEHAIVDRLPTGDAIEVAFLDPELEEFKLNFKRWNMGKSFTYNLTSGWSKVLDEIKDKTLMVGDWVQIWCFQREFKSCFALVNLSPGRGRVVGGSCNGSDGGEGTSSGGDSGCKGKEHQLGC